MASTWDRLNQTVKEFHQSHKDLMLGASVELGNGRLLAIMSLKRVSNICLIRIMRDVENEASMMELAAYRGASGQTEAFSELDRLATVASEHMVEAAQSFERYYDNLNLTCSDVALTVTDWQLLMAEAYGLCSLARKAVAEFVLQDQGEILPDVLQRTATALEDSFVSLMLGRSMPHLPAQPSQELYSDVRNLDGLVHNFLDAVRGQTSSGLSGLASSVCSAADGLGEKYLQGGLVADPGWPGRRVRVLFQQAVRAYKVYSSMVQNEAAEMWAAIEEFESAHAQLLSGGGGLTAILPERQDMQAQWDAIEAVWPAYKQAVTTGESTGQIAMTLGQVQTQLQSAVAVFDIPDVIATDTSPWSLGLLCEIGTFPLLLRRLQFLSQSRFHSSSVMRNFCSEDLRGNVWGNGPDLALLLCVRLPLGLPGIGQERFDCT